MHAGHSEQSDVQERVLCRREEGGRIGDDTLRRGAGGVEARPGGPYGGCTHCASEKQGRWSSGGCRVQRISSVQQLAI